MDCFECVGRGWVRASGYDRPVQIVTEGGPVSKYFRISDLCERCGGSGEEP